MWKRRARLELAGKGSESASKHLRVGFYWNYLWLTGQLFHVMCDLHGFTPASEACGLERFHLQGRGDRAGGITSSAQGSLLSKLFHLLEEENNFETESIAINHDLTILSREDVPFFTHLFVSYAC